MEVVTLTGFEAFFREQQPRLVAVGIALTGDAEEAKELAQEALLRAFRSWDRIADYDEPGRWVRRVLVNLARDRHRHDLVAARLQHRLAADGYAVVPDPQADEWWRAVLSLPERQRAAVALHHLDDLPIREVARILGVSSGTVKASLSHARRTLAKTLSREEDR